MCVLQKQDLLCKSYSMVLVSVFELVIDHKRYYIKLLLFFRLGFSLFLIFNIFSCNFNSDIIAIIIACWIRTYFGWYRQLEQNVKWQWWQSCKDIENGQYFIFSRSLLFAFCVLRISFSHFFFLLFCCCFVKLLCHEHT